MRRKLFSAALVAIAMTKCTSEEDLQVNHSQVSPIKFTVTMDEDGSTRADWGGSNGYTLLWEEGDLMSLFHGAEEGSLASMEDAIYKAAAGNSDRSLEFTTQSMVKEGQAIMVYPADTTFAYLDGGLTVSIPTVQSSTNVLERIPFMSEGIKINPYDGDKNSGAGYGKNYEIKLKQVATQLTLNTVWTGTAKDKIEALVADGTIEPITLENVVLSQPTNKFNTKLNIQLEDKADLGTNWPDEEDGAYDAWNKLSSVDYKNAVATNAILTSSAAVKDDAAGLDKVEFILLPQKTAVITDENASIVINTYYGSVTVDKEDGYAMYALVNGKPYPEEKNIVAYGLNEIISKTTVEKSNENSTFFGEQVGAHATRYIDADLATLDMSTVHIKTDKQLHDILAVYGAIKNGEPVKLTIDGTEGKFSLSMDNVKTLLTEEYKNVKLVPCTVKDEACSVIELTQSAGQPTDEVPELTFIADNQVNVWLGENANWTWTGGKKTFNDFVKMVSNHGTLDVAANAVIADATDAKIRMQNKGTININAGVVKQELELHNFGEINIAENAEYRANGVAIYNWGAGVEFEKQGKVYNSGIFAVNNTSGTINNFGGYIENMIGGTENMTYITANETTDADFAQPWAGNTSNQFGTIMLKNADDNISVSNSTAKGFIKYTYTEEAYVTPVVCKYNYVIVNNHDITFNEGSYKEIKFLEMVSEGNNIPVITQANNYLPELRGFIVNGKANLKENNKMVVPAAYINGTFYYGGLFCIDKQPNTLPKIKDVYYGNSSDDCLVQYK